MNARKAWTSSSPARAGRGELFVLVGSEGESPIEAEARRLENVRVDLVAAHRRPRSMALCATCSIPPSLEPLTQHGNTVLPIKLFLYLAGRACCATSA
jgi:hypothetical protein